MQIQSTIVSLPILMVLMGGCALTGQNDQPKVMSREEALQILTDDDPYSREAIDALAYHARIERDAERQLRLAQYKTCPLLDHPLCIANAIEQSTSDGSPHYRSIAIIKGDPDLAEHIGTVLFANGITAGYAGSMSYVIDVPAMEIDRAKTILKKDSEIHGYDIRIKTNH